MKVCTAESSLCL